MSGFKRIVRIGAVSTTIISAVWTMRVRFDGKDPWYFPLEVSIFPPALIAFVPFVPGMIAGDVFSSISGITAIGKWREQKRIDSLPSNSGHRSSAGGTPQHTIF